MNKLTKETNNNRLVYRELFFKANSSIKKQINALKNPAFCKKCRMCCKIRYSEMAPAEIQELVVQDETIAKRYAELFIPYGADNDFRYDSNVDIDIETNHKEAKKINLEYVEQVTSKLDNPVYFYYCRHLDADNNCSQNYDKSLVCSGFPDDIKTILPKECGFREWQKLAIEKINNEIGKEILLKISEINAHRDNFSCKKCATCCKLATSEFSYEELKEKAKNGDKFATDFTSIFIPYEDLEEPKKIYPEFVEMLLKSLKKDEKVYFYHCPYLGDDDLCTRYETRPDVCREFPSNPLVLFPPSCGFCEWKEDVHVASMLMHALIEICEFNLTNIKKALEE